MSGSTDEDRGGFAHPPTDGVTLIGGRSGVTGSLDLCRGVEGTPTLTDYDRSVPGSVDLSVSPKRIGDS